MAERFALIPNQCLGFGQVLCEVRQRSAALTAEMMENVQPDGGQMLTGCDCPAGGRPAGMRAGAQARTHGHGCAHGRAGAGGSESAGEAETRVWEGER
ncbi:MAG: hypothetical protein PHQ34_04415 [Methanothrix sp.]|nr:hypothetical protein [Methanothrix sp.]